MAYNNHQPNRRCIALTKSGIQCKNTINCSHHRCNDRNCIKERHTRRNIPLTPLSIRQEYRTFACSCTTSVSISPNGNSRCHTGTVPPSLHELPTQNNIYYQNPPFPNEASRISDVNQRDGNDQEQVLGPGHAQISTQNNMHRQNPLFPDQSSRILEVNETHNDGQEQVSGPGHAQIPNQNNMHRQNPLFPDQSSRISEVNETHNDGQEQVA